MRIFNEEGKELGLPDIARHFIDIYPDDIFITGPYPIPEIRELFKKLLIIIRIPRKNITKDHETEVSRS